MNTSNTHCALTGIGDVLPVNEEMKEIYYNNRWTELSPSNVDNKFYFKKGKSGTGTAEILEITNIDTLKSIAALIREDYNDPILSPLKRIDRLHENNVAEVLAYYGDAPNS